MRSFQQASDENVVTAQEDIYKRESSANNDYQNLYDKYRREESAYENLKREYQRRHQDEAYDEDGYSTSRYKRSVDFVEDNTDYVKYKKDLISSLKYEYENDVLKRSDLAGEVLDLSVTFHGTA